jgi:hypothetical protein
MTALQWLRKMILSGHFGSIGASAAAICVLARIAEILLVSATELKGVP